MQKSNKRLRNQLRLIHIFASFILGIFFYSPWRNSQTFLLAMSFAIFPILTLTGLWMWQGARIQKWLKQHPNSSSTT